MTTRRCCFGLRLLTSACLTGQSRLLRFEEMFIAEPQAFCASIMNTQPQNADVCRRTPVDRFYWPLAVLLLSLYAGSLVWLYHGPSAVPDEHWFRGVALELQPQRSWRLLLRSIFVQDNHLGYGSFYWLLYRTCVVITKDPLSLMRALSILFFVSIPASFLYGCHKGTSADKALALLLGFVWLGFPAAWWTGKVSAPEPMAMAAIALALAKLRREGQDRWPVWLLLGFACGLKLTCAPAVVFAASMAAPLWVGEPRRIGKAALAGLGGFVLANPFLLTGAIPAFFATVRQFSATLPIEHTLRAIPKTFVGAAWEWDCLPSNGFFRWGLQLGPSVLFLGWLLAGTLSRHVLLALAAAMALAMLMTASNPHFSGWYWFPTLVVIVASLMWTQVSARRAVPQLAFVAVLNLVLQTQTTLFNIGMKKDHDAALIGRDYIQSSLRATLAAAEPVDFVFDLSDLGLNLDFSYLQREESPPFAYVPPIWASHYAGKLAKPPELCGQGVIIIGKRFLRHPAVGLASEWLPVVYPNISVLSSYRTDTEMEVSHVHSRCPEKPLENDKRQLPN